MATFNSAKTTNPNYMVYIGCAGHNVEVVADLPEQFGSGITTDWESLLPYSLAGALDQIPLVGNWAKAGAAASLGSKTMNLQSQAASFQVWLGTSPIEIPLNLQFDHKTDAYKDVYLPILLLESLGLPITNEGISESSTYDNFMTPPGPTLGGAISEGYGISIRLGRMMMFQNCIISGANHNFDTRLDKNGYPIAGEIEMTFRTSVVYGNIDLLQACGIDVNNYSSTTPREIGRGTGSTTAFGTPPATTNAGPAGGN